MPPFSCLGSVNDSAGSKISRWLEIWSGALQLPGILTPKMVSRLARTWSSDTSYEELKEVAQIRRLI